MIRSELIALLARQFPGLTHRDATKVVDTVFDEITEALARGSRVELRGFGTFEAVARAGRTGRNPRTGEAVEVEAKRVPRFKTGKRLHDRLNPREGTDDGQA